MIFIFWNPFNWADPFSYEPKILKDDFELEQALFQFAFRIVFPLVPPDFTFESEIPSISS